MLKVIQLVVGPLQENCYLLCCDQSRKTVVIDPGDEGQRIIDTMDENSLEPVMILNTHGHGDHIGANALIKETYSIPLLIHEGDSHMLSDGIANFSAMFGVAILSPPADRFITDGEVIEFSSHSITVLHTPGHSPGGVSFLVEEHLFSGDALFNKSVGRTDLPGASHDVLVKGIREKILTLDDDILVYPGHGESTTIGDERRSNPYL